MSTTANATRRDFLMDAAKSTAVASLATIVPAHVMGRENRVPPSGQIALGVIGIGPRCTYDLQAMLKFADVRLRGDRRSASQTSGCG